MEKSPSRGFLPPWGTHSDNFQRCAKEPGTSWHGCSLKISLLSQKKRPGSVSSINYLKEHLRLRMSLYIFFSRNYILLLFLTLKKKNLRPANQSAFFISSFYSLNYPEFHLPTNSSSPRCSLLHSGSILHSHSIH